MRQTPVPLSRPSRVAPNDAAAPRRAPLGVKLALAGVVVAAVGFFALRWLDDTTARDQVQVLQTLPQSDASRTASPSAVTYPFAKDDHAPDAAASAAAATSPPPRAQAPVATRPVPPGVTPGQWQALVAEMSARPDGERELARLDAYFRFADTVRQFRELNRASGADPTPALVALAQRIDAELDTHVAQRELAGSEAYDIKATVLEVLEPDADAADDKLERWAAGLPRSRTDSDRAAMQRDTEFELRRKALIQAWSTQPVQARDPRALERDIQNLRQEIYGKPAR